jgi:5-methylcytosine-specific restriction endonuclease McrA
MDVTKKTRKAGSKWARPDLRLAVYLRDGRACVYCQRDASMGAVLSLDHVIPVIHKGSNHPTNLVTACVNCNSSRQDRPMVEWLDQLQEVYGRKGRTAIEKRLDQRTVDLLPYRRAAQTFLKGLESGGRTFKNMGEKVMEVRPLSREELDPRRWRRASN